MTYEHLSKESFSKPINVGGVIMTLLRKHPI